MQTRPARTASDLSLKTQPNYELRHPFFEWLEPLRIKARDLFSGSDIVKDPLNAATYLFRLATEAQTLYDFRLKRAVYDNWLSPVIEARQAMIWRKAPVRDKFPALVREEWRENVDGSGLDADAFFEQATEDAQVDGMAWVLVDAPRRAFKIDLATGEFIHDELGRPIPEDLTMAEAEARGERPVMARVPAGNVIDWQFGPDGKLDYAVIRTWECQSAGPGRLRVEEPRWKVWTREKWTVFRRESDGKANVDDSGFNEVLSGPNEVGEVPLVCFYGARLGLGQGVPVVRDILDHVVSIYNKFSDRDMAEFLTNNPIPVIVAPDPPDKVSVSYGLGIRLKSSPDNSKIEAFYMQTTTSGVTASRESERDLIRRIVETTLRQSKRDTSQVQSADGLKAESKIFASSLASVAREFERSERECWRLMALFAGTPPASAGSAEIAYNRDFDDAAIDAQLLSTFSGMVREGQLSRDSLWEIMRRGEVLPDDFDAAEEARLIEEEKDAASLGVFPAPVPPGPEEDEEPEEDDEEPAPAEDEPRE